MTLLNTWFWFGGVELKWNRGKCRGFLTNVKMQWGFLREKKRRQGNGPTLFQPTNRHRTELKIRPDATIYFFLQIFFLFFS